MSTSSDYASDDDFLPVWHNEREENDHISYSSYKSMNLVEFKEDPCKAFESVVSLYSWTYYYWTARARSKLLSQHR